MQLNDIQIEILNDNLSKAHQLAELMYQASIEPAKQYISIGDWQEQLDLLSSRLDGMRGVYFSK
jgi:hydroxymethylpyrimidine pyrophosphatase-like HAD family hydrolase